MFFKCSCQGNKEIIAPVWLGMTARARATTLEQCGRFVRFEFMFPCMPAMLACSQACFASIRMPTGMTPISHRPHPALISCSCLYIFGFDLAPLWPPIRANVGVCRCVSRESTSSGYDPTPIWPGRCGEAESDTTSSRTCERAGRGT